MHRLAAKPVQVELEVQSWRTGPQFVRLRPERTIAGSYLRPLKPGMVLPADATQMLLSTANVREEEHKPGEADTEVRNECAGSSITSVGTVRKMTLFIGGN